MGRSMQYQELLNYKPQIMKLFNRYGVTNPRVFGSTAKGTARKESDIDFLVTWSVKHNLIDRIQLKTSLEELLHQRVDLVTDKTLHVVIRDAVIKSAKPL